MKQQSDHYKKEIETIEFMRISKGEEAVKSFVLLTAFKYWDRLGKKDATEKDSYKMLDYMCYFHFGKWFHELKDTEAEKVQEDMKFIDPRIEYNRSDDND